MTKLRIPQKILLRGLHKNHFKEGKVFTQRDITSSPALFKALVYKDNFEGLLEECVKYLNSLSAEETT